MCVSNKYKNTIDRKGTIKKRARDPRRALQHGERDRWRIGCSRAPHSLQVTRVWNDTRCTPHAADGTWKIAPLPSSGQLRAVPQGARKNVRAKSQSANTSSP